MLIRGRELYNPIGVFWSFWNLGISTLITVSLFSRNKKLKKIKNMKIFIVGKKVQGFDQMLTIKRIN